jgi:hypothetical protein
MKKTCEVNEKKILDDLVFAHRFQWAPGFPLSKSGAATCYNTQSGLPQSQSGRLERQSYFTGI